MKYRIVLILTALLAVCSCGTMMQSGTGSGDSAGTAGKVASSKDNLSPSSSDVNKYGDDTDAWLKDSVSDYSQYQNAVVIVDDKVVTDISAVKLSKVKKVSLFERAPSLKSGDKSTRGAIVISTK